MVTCDQRCRSTWKQSHQARSRRGLGNFAAAGKDDFARCFVEHLIAYGLGRPFGFTDEGLANEILTTAKSKHYSVSEFVQALVQSKAFHTK
jgi:hypothetical protein